MACEVTAIVTETVDLSRTRVLIGNNRGRTNG
jgi:hypothetical protein